MYQLVKKKVEGKERDHTDIITDASLKL